MTYREEQFMKQMTEIAIKVAELRAENKLLKSFNDSIIQALHKPVVSGKRPFECPNCNATLQEVEMTNTEILDALKAAGVPTRSEGKSG